MNNDPADLDARSRRSLGMVRRLQQERRDLPHPSRGGTRCYPVWWCEQEVQQFIEGDDTESSSSTVYRWIERVRPYRMAGNKDSNRLVSFDLFLLSLCIFMHPDATQDQIATFIFNEGGGLYSRSDISRTLADLKVTRKRSSTEAYQAHLPHNIF